MVKVNLKSKVPALKRRISKAIIMCDTKIYDMSDENNYNFYIHSAAECILRGGIVAFPTETVYGLGANAFDEGAVDKIFQAKGRPNDNPLIVHIASKGDVSAVAEDISQAARMVIDAFMPGPISVILKKRSVIAYNVSASLPTVAVRMPSQKQAHDFIKACGVPIAAPSANISGKPSPTKAEHVIHDLNGRADIILAGEDSTVGLESTVVDMSSERIVILRPGAVSAEMISKVTGKPVYYSAESSDSSVPKAPGMKYRHYKPEAKVICVCGDMNKTADYIKKAADASDCKCAALIFDEAEKPDNALVLSLGSIDTPQTAAKSLFSHLRYCDECGISAIYAMCPHDEGIGKAYRNRIFKAADETIIL